MENIDLAKLTKEEEAILRLTEEVWNRFLELPINHPSRTASQFYKTKHC